MHTLHYIKRIHHVQPEGGLNMEIRNANKLFIILNTNSVWHKKKWCKYQITDLFLWLVSAIRWDEKIDFLCNTFLLLKIV